jgi:ABC-type glycerol-3-phosphate transport system substrate-binding protein
MKFNLKSNLTKIMVFIFLFSSLFMVSCKKTLNESDENELSIVFVQSWGDDVNKYFKELTEKWGTENRINVKLEIIPIKDIDLKMTAWVQSPVGDLALLPTNLAMVNTTKLEDISALSLSISKMVNGYYDIGRDMGAIKDNWFNIPFCAWPHVWFYKKDLLEGWARGLPKTYDEAKLLCEWLKKKHPEIYPFGICLSQDEDFSMFLQTIMWAYGGGVIASDGRTVILSNNSNRAAFQFILDMYKADFIPKGALGWDASGNNNQFMANKTVITANALSIDYVAKRRNPELYKQIIHSAYPAGPNGRFSFVQTFGWVIKHGSKKQSMAENFLKYLYERQRLEKLFMVGEGAICPLQKSIGQTDFWKGERYIDAIESVESAKALGWPGPFTREAAEVYNRRILNTIFARVINDNLSLDDAMKEATEKVRLIYKER